MAYSRRHSFSPLHFKVLSLAFLCRMNKVWTQRLPSPSKKETNHLSNYYYFYNHYYYYHYSSRHISLTFWCVRHMHALTHSLIELHSSLPNGNLWSEWEWRPTSLKLLQHRCERESMSWKDEVLAQTTMNNEPPKCSWFVGSSLHACIYLTTRRNCWLRRRKKMETQNRQQQSN